MRRFQVKNIETALTSCIEDIDLCDEIKRKYQLEGVIGHGSNSIVLLAKHRELGILRAIKQISKSSDSLSCILKETHILKNLKHSGIPVIYDIEEDDQFFCIVEEYVNGKSLKNIVQEQGKLKSQELINIAIKLSGIIQYLHSENIGILHMDIKPDNIIIDNNGDIKLVDFDNSVFFASDDYVDRGSPCFAAPEQYLGLKPGKSSDIYSLGMLLLYMATGCYMQSHVKYLRQKKLQKIIKKCISHSTFQRYQKIEDIINELESLKKECHYPVESRIINVIGIKGGVGTTHFCKCLAAYLIRKKFKVLLADRSNNDSIYNYARLYCPLKDGTYNVNGISFMPDYGELVNTTEIYDSYEIIINDYGSIEWCKEHNICFSNDLNIIVGPAERYWWDYYVSQEQYIKENILIDSKNTINIVNLIDGIQYYNMLRNIKSYAQYTPIRWYRMPCVYDWNIDNNITEELFEDIIKLLLS